MATRSKKEETEESKKPGFLLQLNPDLILAEENSRFGLKETRIETMMKSILEAGGVMEPVEVEPLLPIETSNGFQYRLTSGFYRHAAVARLNKEGAGLTLPAQIHQNLTAQERIRRQLIENMERENQSPMDMAVAIKKLFDANYSRAEIREMFARPGGRKGLKLQPASNSFINMILSFLQFPKDIQAKIHDGRLSVSGAYEMTKQPKDKWPAILERSEADRIAVVEREEKEDKKLAEAEAKKAEAEKKQQEQDNLLLKALEAEAKAKAELDAAIDAAKTAYDLKAAAKGEAKKEADKAFKKAEVDRSDAVVAFEKAKKEAADVKKKQEAAAKATAERAERLRQAREGHTKAKEEAVSKTVPAGGISGQDIKKAAAKEGTGTVVRRSLTEIREGVRELTVPGCDPKVKTWALYLLEFFDGKTTHDQLYKKLVSHLS